MYYWEIISFWVIIDIFLASLPPSFSFFLLSLLLLVLLYLLAYVFSTVFTINMHFFFLIIEGKKNDSFVLSPPGMNFAFWVLNFMAQR